MKNFLLLIFFVQSMCSQVGVNTINPTKTLDVNGEARIRVLPSMPSASTLIATDANGNLGLSSSYLLSDILSSVAVAPINISVTGETTVNNLDLNLGSEIRIPAGKQALVVVSYSVPIGFGSTSGSRGYYGVRFLRNGLEAASGSRKTTIQTNSPYNMTTISNIYTESLPAQNTDQTIRYALNGYIEQTSVGTTHSYRFNMWDANEPNYNWGRASLIVQVFIR